MKQLASDAHDVGNGSGNGAMRVVVVLVVVVEPVVPVLVVTVVVVGRCSLYTQEYELTAQPQLFGAPIWSASHRYQPPLQNAS
jgi:hypothetical protein